MLLVVGSLLTVLVVGVIDIDVVVLVVVSVDVDRHYDTHRSR